MEYIYLVASLPRLELGAAPPLTPAELLQVCSGLLREDHWDDLRAILEDRPADVRAPEARRYVDAETQLRNDLLRLRTQRAGVPIAGRPREHEGYDARVAAVAARAMAAEGPLERELALDGHRWTLLDEIAALPAFGAQAVFAYGFKLRLAEKWAAMSDAGGRLVATQIVEGNLAGQVA
ncbi:MAG: hypothetical protein WC709_12620 [Thermoleophilia bacterium]